MNFEKKTIQTPNGQTKYEVRVWWPGRDGRQIRRRFSKRADMQNFVDSLLSDRREAEKPRSFHEEAKSDEPTFGTEYEYWLKHRQKDFSPGWKITVDGYWDSLKSVLENKKVSEITPQFLDEIDQKLFDEKQNSRKTINQKIGWIQSVLNFSVDRKRIQSHEVVRYKKPKAPKPDIEFWEKEQALSFLTFADQKYPAWVKDRASGKLIYNVRRQRYLAYKTVLNTALRGGELWGLKPNSLKSNMGQIRVTQELNRVSKELKELKGNEARSVPLNSDLALELEEWIRETRVRASDFIFNYKGTAIDHDNFVDIFSNDVRDWGGTKIKFHGLRHTSATLMLLAGVDVRTVQKILGHKDISTTMRYLHVIGNAISDVASRFSLGQSGVPKLEKAEKLLTESD